MSSYFGRSDPSMYSHDQWGRSMVPFQREDRYRNARSHLGFGDSQNPYLGLLAAANRDSDPRSLSGEEVEYGVELARRAREQGDAGFNNPNNRWNSPTDNSFRDVLNALKNKGTDGVRGLWEAGEAPIRAGSFLRRTGQQNYTYGQFFSDKGGEDKGWKRPASTLIDWGRDRPGLKDEVQDRTTERDTARDERDLYKGERDTYLGERDEALSKVEGYADWYSPEKYQAKEAEVGDLKTTIGGLEDDVTDYEGKWQSALALAESAQAEAAQYREQSVGSQLAGLRGGMTIAGDQQIAGGGGLASGRAGRLRASDDNIVNIQKEVDASDSVIRNKGPIVDLIRAGRGSSAPGRSGLAGGIPNARGYYASRFR